MQPLIRPYRAEKFLDKSAIGVRLDYHEGYLPKDRQVNHEVDRIASQMLEAAEDGMVHLFQEKIADYHYRYFALKRALRAKQPIRREQLVTEPA